MQPTYKYTIGNKQSTMGNSSNWFYCPPIFLQFLKCYNRTLSCSHSITHAFSLSVSLSDIFPTSFSSTSDILPHLPISPPPPPLYSYIPCSYLYNCLVASQILRDIFLYFISFLPSLILEFWLFGGCLYCSGCIICIQCGRG